MFILHVLVKEPSWVSVGDGLFGFHKSRPIGMRQDELALDSKFSCGCGHTQLQTKRDCLSLGHCSVNLKPMLPLSLFKLRLFIGGRHPCNDVCVEARGQVAESCLSFYHGDSGDQTQVIKLGGKLNHPTPNHNLSRTVDTLSCSVLFPRAKLEGGRE